MAGLPATCYMLTLLLLYFSVVLVVHCVLCIMKHQIIPDYSRRVCVSEGLVLHGYCGLSIYNSMLKIWSTSIQYLIICVKTHNNFEVPLTFNNNRELRVKQFLHQILRGSKG